jgi:hypothetical protein
MLWMRAQGHTRGAQQAPELFFAVFLENKA